MRSAASLIALLLVGGCARDPARMAARASIEATPSWKTEEGRKEIWRDVANWAIENNLPDEALSMVSRLREAGENTSDLDVIQARALAAQGLPEEARGMLATVVQNEPRNAAAWRAYGVVLADLGKRDEAIDAFRRALKFNAEDVPTRNNLGFLLMAADACEEAVEHLTAVVAADGTSARYRNNLAFATACAGDHDRALDLFQSTGTGADARFNLGLAYERMGRVSDAIVQYEEAIRYDPQYPPARDALARLDTESETPTSDEGVSP